MQYLVDAITIILILGLYGRIYWMRREMDIIRLGIEVAHDILFDSVADTQERLPNTPSEVALWDES
jgi:hypothetical protein|tara:strand:+ start:1203 stop:1400 length:198 start_codon:yes stop_codon:yes gene_type:complete